jgi:hypothetical protein
MTESLYINRGGITTQNRGGNARMKLLVSTHPYRCEAALVSRGGVWLGDSMCRFGGCTPTSKSMASTTSSALVTCHAARVFLLDDPTVVENKLCWVSERVTGSLATSSPSMSFAEAGGCMIAAPPPTEKSVQSARNMSSSVCKRFFQLGGKKLDVSSTHLVISRAEDEFSVGIIVQNTLDDLSLVDGDRPDLKILLSDQDY